ncbi:MAG: hypothetical protein GY940_05810, partial [bacterium]|nr:hypothetical protein [bacterium]
YIKNKSKALFAIAYIAEAKTLSQKKIIELLEESQIDGGEAMETWLDKAINEKLTQGRNEGRVDGKREVAVGMLKNGVDIDTVVKYTGLSKEEIEALAETVH